MEMEASGAVAFEKSDYSRGDHRIVLPPECIPLFADGISLILSRWVKLQMAVARSRNRWFGVAEYLRLTCGKAKHEAVEKMAADILAFFLQPEERCHGCINKKANKKAEEPCNVGHVQYLLYELCRNTFSESTVGPSSLMEVGNILFNLHQDLLQGKYDSAEKLGKTLTWIGEDQLERLRKDEDEELEAIRNANANKHRKISRRQRQKIRAYLVKVKPFVCTVVCNGFWNSLTRNYQAVMHHHHI
ncbi:hypothetical protein MKW98_028238 [Papaver atlanticum]|uniref:Uncharacterized protein n=1 Tax=Papaver atlanticum TaxID=357466 RepID=A0AAD4SVW6_9MAGN|nr:hypothetical protein MKW98_028238 [Papaver atlanticum]